MQKVPVLLIFAAVLGGCVASVYSTWNEDDACLLSAQLAEDILTGSWLREYSANHDELPVILPYKLDNLSREQFPLHGLEDKLALELLRSGKVKLVLPKEDYSEASQTFNQNPDPGMPIEQAGADLLLKGSIDILPDNSQLIFKLELLLIEARSGKLLHRTFRMRQKPLKQPKTRTA